MDITFVGAAWTYRARQILPSKFVGATMAGVAVASLSVHDCPGAGRAKAVYR